jgi:hypothetical protein
MMFQYAGVSHCICFSYQNEFLTFYQIQKDQDPQEFLLYINAVPLISMI